MKKNKKKITKKDKFCYKIQHCALSREEVYDELILSFDISTTLSAYSILDNNGRLLFFTSFEIISDSYVYKLDQIENDVVKSLYKFIKLFNFKKLTVVVEQFNLGYKFTNIKTLSGLAIVNTFLQYVIHKTFDIDVNTVYAITARSKLGIKKIGEENIKDVVFSFIENKYNEISEIKSQMNKTSAIKNSGLFDICDSIVLGLYYIDSNLQK
jgi:hypothetical protein